MTRRLDANLPSEFQASTNVRLCQFGESLEQVRPVVILKVKQNSLDRDPRAANHWHADHDVWIDGDAFLLVQLACHT